MEAEFQILKADVAAIKSGQNEMKDALKDIATSMKSLTRLEIQHKESRDALQRAFEKIEDHEQRVRKIETDMPNLKLSSKWVFIAVLGALSLLGTASLMTILGAYH